MEDIILWSAAAAAISGVIWLVARRTRQRWERERAESLERERRLIDEWAQARARHRPGLPPLRAVKSPPASTKRSATPSTASSSDDHNLTAAQLDLMSGDSYSAPSHTSSYSGGGGTFDGGGASGDYGSSSSCSSSDSSSSSSSDSGSSSSSSD